MDGKAYCRDCYFDSFAPKCAGCNQAITDNFISALNSQWHPDCFVCWVCVFIFWFRFHFFNFFSLFLHFYFFIIFFIFIFSFSFRFNPFLTLLSSQDCKCPFVGGSFFDYEGKPYCETHYHAKRGSLCAGCHKPITGRCITAMFRKFHPEHFVCAFCLKQLNKGTFKEQNDKPYCHTCFDKLFS